MGAGRRRWTEYMKIGTHIGVGRCRYTIDTLVQIDTGIDAVGGPSGVIPWIYLGV